MHHQAAALSDRSSLQVGGRVPTLPEEKITLFQHQPTNIMSAKKSTKKPVVITIGKLKGTHVAITKKKTTEGHVIVQLPSGDYMKLPKSAIQ